MKRSWHLRNNLSCECNPEKTLISYEKWYSQEKSRMTSGSNSKVCDSVMLFHRMLSESYIDSRRAAFHIGNNTYSAKLVDLPCIIESQKTLDNKQMFKVADICQVTSFLGF